MRYAIHRLANPLPITGFVENLDDGRVRIVAEGEAEVLGQWIESIQTNAPGAIHRLERHTGLATSEFSNFTIKR